MDRLVKVEVAEVELHYEPLERCSAAIKVSSLIHTMPVAVQFTTTRPGLFSFSPAAVALLTPLSSTVIRIVLPPTQAPPLDSPPDVLFVRSALAPTLHRADNAALIRFFARPTLPIFRDASLPIQLLGPHVLRHLILSRSGDNGRRSSSLLTRVIGSCSRAELSEALHLAAAAGANLSALIEAGADPDSCGTDGKSAISVAASVGNIDAVKTLISAGATDRPFHEAASANRTDLIELLAGSGSGCYWGKISDHRGRTPVHAAAKSGAIDALLMSLSSAAAGDPDLADIQGWTPLHCAAAGGHLQAAEVIIRSSAFDPRRALTKGGRGRSRRTPLDIATEKGHFLLYDLLRPGGHVIKAARSARGELCFRSMESTEERDQNGWTALHVAAFKGRLEAVRQLVEGGAEVEVVDDDGYTPLRCAVEAGHAEVAIWLNGYGDLRGRMKGLLHGDEDNGDGEDGCGSCGPAPRWETCAAVVPTALCRNEDDNVSMEA
ncbi:hypothetical protein HPP92_006947 [Vanilla planifolia]|uniref:Uncharacterized protein n=1 Tax=Vanilla planifolia TaxID=51239 RepID=A0A835R991_VANPL|nr:hypothetical protein HPP92_006947 [Vanilla planifolia]